MNKSESIKEIAGALSQAQAEMPAVKFNSTNPFLKNKYADLGALIETSKKVLATHGLSVSQLVESQDNKIGVTTILMHNSGEWLESTCWLELGDERGKSNAQVAGSIITYLRRYSIASILGMYADEDGDGNKPPEKATPAKAGKPQPHAPSVGHDLVDVAIAEGGKVSSTMSLETAEAVTSSDGTRYGDIETEKLVHMANAITKSIKKNGISHEEHETRQMKLDAIRVILESRNG